MPPDRSLLDADAGQPPSDTDVQQLREAESGMGTQGILRRWQASNSAAVVLTSDATGVKISRDAGATAPQQVIVDGTTAGGGLSGTYPNPTLSAAMIDALVPPGTILAWAGAGAAYPSGWLPCDGSTASRTTYAKLFAVIGVTYNTGGEAGTDFRLPNLTGRVILGSSGLHPLTTSGGADAGPPHTHTGSHSHGAGTLSATLSGHFHGLATTHVHAPGTHTHGLGTHTHALTASHNHGIGGHDHDMTHTHTTDINHDHGNAVGAAAGSPTATNSILNGTGAATTVPASNHVHPVDLPGLGSIVITSAGQNNTVVGGPHDPGGGTATGTVVGTPSTQGPAGASDGPGAGDTGAVVGTPSTAAPSTDSTGAFSGTTASDSSAPAATYTAPTTANLPPYLAVGFIIRAG